MRFPIVATHPCNLIHNPLRQLFTKSRFRLTRIETTLSEELVTYLRSLESCLWLVGVERCLATTNALVRRVVTTTPGVKAVILAAHQTPNDIIPALEAGACGFLCQDTSAERLLKSLELIVVGEMVVHPQLDVVPQTTNGKAHVPQPLDVRSTTTCPLVPMEPSSENQASDVAPLSRREIQILRMLTEGASNKAIALRLVITEATVKVLMKTLLKKLRLNNRTQAAMWAHDHFSENT